MHVILHRVVWLFACNLFLAMRWCAGRLLKTLPEGHPYRVFQESLFSKYNAAYVRQAWRPEPSSPRGGIGRRLRVAAAAMAVSVVPVLVTAIPVVLFV